jgi:hypothetical protein
MSGCGDDNPDDERREAAVILGNSERHCYRITGRVTKQDAKGVMHTEEGQVY